MKTYKWGIIGCGNIAGKLAQDLALIDNAELTAVASRSLEKAKVFGAEYNAKKAYGSYDDLFNDNEVEIVYIATPHTSHAELSIKAMEHGKHVLCEKPVAMNKKDTELMIATSKKTNTFFMEALWTRFNPTFLAVLKHINNGDIGDIKYINADFAFNAGERSLEGRLFNKSLGGGSLLDIGIYPIFLSYAILGMPKNIIASATLHPTTGADIETSMLFDFDNAKALLYSGLTSNTYMSPKISGTKGEIIIDHQWHHADGYTIIKDSKKETVELPKTGIGYYHEILECQECLSKNKTESDLWSHQNSLDLIELLDTVRNKIGLEYN